MAAKKQMVRIVGKVSHPFMSWSDIRQDFDGQASPEAYSKPQGSGLERNSITLSSDSSQMMMKKGRRKSKIILGIPTSSLNESTASSTSFGSLNSQLKLYTQRWFGRQNQDLPASKSKNVASANVSEDELLDFNPKSSFHERNVNLIEEFNAEKESNSSKSSLKIKSAALENAINPVKFASTVKILIGKQKNVKCETPKSTSIEVTNRTSANEIDVDVNSSNKKSEKKSRPKSPGKKNVVSKGNSNLKVQNKVKNVSIRAAQEPSEEKIDLKINISESEIEINPQLSIQKIKKKEAFASKRSIKPKVRVPSKSRKKTFIKVTTDPAESNSNTINVDVIKENVKIKDESDHSRPNILHLNPKEMRKSSSVIKKSDGIVNNAKKKAIVIELKPSEVNKSENAWKLASNRLKERFRHENFAYLESSFSVPELSEDDKPLSVIKIFSAPVNLNTQNKRSVNLSHQLPFGKIDDFEMKWRMEAMKQLLVGDQDRELLEDIIVKAGNKSYGCCRLLLVLTSRYFRHQLRVGNLEACTTFELKLDAGDENVRAVLEWMHTTDIDLTIANVGEILYLCHILGIDSLAGKCQGMLEVLREHDGDAVTLYEYATDNNMNKVAKEAAEIASDNFLKLVRSEKFLDYTYKQLCMLFYLEDIRFNSEVDVFYAVWRWLAHSWDYRKRYKDNLIHCVMLEKMSLEEIQCLAGALIEEEWGPENPLTWGTDGYMISGLIRGLLSSQKLGLKCRMEKEQAAIVIQRKFRKWAKNKKAKAKRKKGMRKGMAARIIQTSYNEYKVRKQWEIINQAALEIQRCYRGFATRKAMKKRENAAVVIQRAFRKSKDHERRNKLLQLAAPKPRKKKYKRGQVRRKIK